MIHVHIDQSVLCFILIVIINLIILYHHVVDHRTAPLAQPAAPLPSPAAPPEVQKEPAPVAESGKQFFKNIYIHVR